MEKKALASDHEKSSHPMETRTSTSPFLIGVGGGTASGKSSVCRKIMEKLGQYQVDNHQRRVVCISQESFYRDLNDNERIAANKGIYNFDHPNALDNELMLTTLKEILEKKIVKIPVYDFVNNSRKSNEFKTVYPADVVLFEGILSFYFPEIRDLFDMKLFVDTDPDTRLSKRVIRDVKDRERDLELVISQYINFVKPAFEEFCQPTKKWADVIIPRGADNEVAINLIMKYAEKYLEHCDHRRHSTISTDHVPNVSNDECVPDLNVSKLDRKLECMSLDDDKLGQIRSDNASTTNPLQALLTNLCYQVTYCDERHQTKSKTENDLIIIK